MRTLDWLVVGAWLIFVVGDSLRRTRGTTGLAGYFLANRSLPWWAVGLSVMATQLSAITMIGTTGQGATDGLRFVQFYFGLPLAMVILGVTLVPFLHGAGVYTAYEYLERRFDARTRSLTAFLFLCSRGLSCGTIIAAPAVVFASIFGWDLRVTVALIGVPTVLYTMIGGVQAVAWADVKQMFVIVGSLVAIVVVLLVKIPVGAPDVMEIAGAAGRLKALDFTFDVTQTYTVWSGLIGGTFLMLSYFGTDQSQVQRYLTAKSVDEARTSLLMSAYWKIPLQALILMIGVLIFVFYVFVRPPLLFNPVHDAKVKAAEPQQYEVLDARYGAALGARTSAARQVAMERTPDTRALLKSADSSVNAVRAEALSLVTKVTGESKPRDVNYIIPHFVRTQLPVGLAGLFIAAILAAAMSAVSAELNSLASASVIDFYRRWVKADASDDHYLMISKGATAFWGLCACVVATYAASLGSLIEVVNRFGSFFYGSILGVFLLAMVKRSTALGAFVGLIVGMGTVFAVSTWLPSVAFLWHNVIGAVTVFVVGTLLSVARPAVPDAPAAA
ncbi:MAG: sodium:solute symporter [Gemmatimonadaceae bacterium]|nr:sodium:solute symporter [Gemmatimonadaceae bacterium]